MKPNGKTQLFLPVLGTYTVVVLTLPVQQRGGKIITLAAVVSTPNAFQDIGCTWVWIYISAGGQFTFQPLDLCEKLLSYSLCLCDFSSLLLMNTHRLNASGNKWRHRELQHNEKQEAVPYDFREWKCMWVFIFPSWSRKPWSSVKINVAGLPLLKTSFWEQTLARKDLKKIQAWVKFTLLFCSA